MAGAHGGAEVVRDRVTMALFTCCFAAATFLLWVAATADPEHSWLYTCAQHRPLADCRADYRELHK